MGKVIHSQAGTVLYKRWIAIKKRCNNPNNVAYHRYGGRGIKLCERWQTFLNFKEDLGEIPPGSTLDRIDNNKDYCPENCRWATCKEQMNNTSRNHMITLNGKTDTLANWCMAMNVNYQMVIARLGYGWSPERALLSKRRDNRDRPSSRGENNPRAKLTWDIVRAIRSERAADQSSIKELSIKHSVDKSTISSIAKNHTWRES